METTKLQKKIIRKESESKRYGDNIQQKQSNQHYYSGCNNDEDVDGVTENGDEKYTLPHIPTQWRVNDRNKDDRTITISLTNACDRTDLIYARKHGNGVSK